MRNLHVVKQLYMLNSNMTNLKRFDEFDYQNWQSFSEELANIWPNTCLDSLIRAHGYAGRRPGTSERRARATESGGKTAGAPVLKKTMNGLEKKKKKKKKIE